MEHNLTNTNLFKAELEGGLLHEADLSGADLSGANLSNADLSKANLSNVNLSNADLSKANLFQTHFKQTKVISAKFVGSDISRAILDETPLWGAIFEPKEEKANIGINFQTRIKRSYSSIQTSNQYSLFSNLYCNSTSDKRMQYLLFSNLYSTAPLYCTSTSDKRNRYHYPKVYGDAPRNGERSQKNASLRNFGFGRENQNR